MILCTRARRNLVCSSGHPCLTDKFKLEHMDWTQRQFVIPEFDREVKEGKKTREVK